MESQTDFSKLESSSTVLGIDGSNITDVFIQPKSLNRNKEDETIIPHKSELSLAFDEPISVPIYNVNGELVRLLEPGEKPTWQCIACHKAFVTKQSLERHKERHPLCKEWEIRENKYNMEQPNESAYDWAMKIIENNLSNNIENKIMCKYCHKPFSNVGNLHKHFNSAVVCNKLAYMKIKEAFVSSNPSHLEKVCNSKV